MKRILLLLFISSLINYAYAQRPGGGFKRGGGESKITGKITGKLIDSTSQAAIPYASIVLLNAKDNKQINGVLSDENGKFKFSAVKIGTYKLQVSFIGYNTKKIAAITMTKKKPDVNLDLVEMSQNSVLLGEVEVVEDAPVILNQIDKIVYNAEKDVTSTGGDAADVLRKVPLLSVDLEGNVSLRGSQNLRILINGKPSGMFSASVADALKMIPADQIKSVEVITTPTAKYDGEGSGGIINILTKKKSIDGFSGSFNGSAGNLSNNGVLNLSLTRGRFGINATGSVFYSNPRDGLLTFIRETTNNDTTLIYKQDGITETSRIGFNGNVGAFYDINAYNSINSSFRIRGFGFDQDGVTNTNLSTLPVSAVFNPADRTQLSNTLNSGYDWNIDYTRSFDDKDKEFTLSYQLIGNVSKRDTDTDYTDDLNAIINREQQENDGINQEHTLQADYKQRLSKKIKLETGLKSILRKIDSDYLIQAFDFTQNDFVTDQFRSNKFDYFQDVYAGYASFNITLGKDYSMILGARYEHTDLEAAFEDAPSTTNSYSNFLPNFIISKKLKNFSSIKLSYNQRIQRPNLYYINPYRQDFDPLNITFGNPLLEPEVTHQVELNYTTFVKGSVINTALYYRRTNDVIESFLNVTDEGVSINTFQNIGTNNSFGLNTFTSVKIKKWLTLRGGFNVFTYDVSAVVDGETLSNSAIQYSGNVSGTISLPKDFKIEAFGFFRAPRFTIQGENPSFSIFSLGFKKDILKKKGSIGIRIVEPFNKNKSFITELSGDGFYQFNDFTIPFRSFGLNFSYRFGKLDFKAKSRKTKIKNDDQKQGENNQGGF